MSIEAIVYTSNTGNTAQYAKLLAARAPLAKIRFREDGTFFLNHCSLKAQVREGCSTMPIEDEPEDLPVYYFMIA